MSRIYLEGGGESKELRTRCREAFRKLLEKCGYSGRMPRLIASGGRNAVFGDFTTAMQGGDGRTFMLLDSEDPVADVEATWNHLETRDGWERPHDVQDEQVLFMTTCMETWIVADHAALRKHYGNEFQAKALPPLTALETRPRHTVMEKLTHATRNCSTQFRKGSESFRILERVDPDVLQQHLPSFARARRILDNML